jgi:hypothetical protein
MKKFEYDITKHPANQFIQMVYFCTDQGECNYEQLAGSQMDTLRDILNERGSEGWELVQLFFGKDGVVCIWRREA